MTTAIQFLRSNVPGLRPAPLSLADGMPMINYNPQDPGLYFKSSGNTLIKIGPTQIGKLPPNSNPSGFVGYGIGEMWLDTDTSPGVFKPRPILKIWSGSAWVAAGGDILQEELPQSANTFLVGPLSGPDVVPTFRLIDNLDLPDDIDYHKLAGGEVEGGLLIGGGVPGWEVANLTMGPGLTQTVGPNLINLEVTAGDIAADGQPGVNFDQGDGHIQLNYDGKFTGDSRFKFINKYDGAAEDKFIAHVSTELGQDPLTHTHIIKGDTTLSGDLTLTDVYSIDASGDLTIGHNVVFGAGPADTFRVYSTSSFHENVELIGLKDLTVGGDIIGTNNLTVGTGDTNTHTLTGDVFLSGNTTIGRDCTDGISVLGTSVFDCLATFNEGIVIPGDNDLVVGGNVLLGTDCTNTIGMQGTQYNKCDILIGENLPAANSELIKFDAATGLGQFKNNVEIDGNLSVGNANPGFRVVVDGSEGDIDASGTITASYFVGDGSQLFNLAVPNSMLFHGDIDATVGPVPSNPIAGDFYLHTGPSTTVVANWPNIGGSPIQQDQFIYFYDDGLGGKWAKGSVQNQQGFVTINTNQDINGTKTFTVHQQFDSTITVEGHTQLNNTLTVEKHTQHNETLTVATNKATLLGGTLTVKGHTQLDNTLTVANGNKTTLGGDLQVKQNTVIGSSCANTLDVNAETKFLCGLTIGDPNNPCSTGNFDVYSPLNVYCPETVYNTLTVSGNYATTLGGTLSVAGNVSVNNKFNITASDGNTSIAGTLTVAGHTQFNNTLTVANDKATILGGTLQVKKATQLDTTLTVSGHTQLNNTLTVSDNRATVLGGTLQVKQATSLNSTLTVAGHTQLNNTLTVADGQATVLGGTTMHKLLATFGTSTNCGFFALHCNGTSTFECLATFNAGINIPGTSDLHVGGNLTVDGNTTLGSNCSNTLTVNATTTVKCAATFDSTVLIKNTTTAQHINPQANNTYDLGTSSAKWKNAYATTFHGNLSGNATTATTLQTARNINGTSFNGSANITTAQWGTARTITIGSTGKSVNGSANFAWSLAEIGVNNVGINFNAGTGLSQSGANATTNQAAATTKTFSIDRSVVDTWYAPASTVSAADGQINFNAGTGLLQSGNNATANQSGNTTKTFSIDKSYFDGLYQPVGAAGQWEISGSNLLPLEAGKHVVPRSDGNANLGSTSLRWANVYTQDMHFSNEGTEGNSVDGTTGNWTLQEGHDHLYFINNKTGVKFRVVMEKV